MSRIRSKTIGRKEIAREFRRERADGVVDLELVQLRAELEKARPRCRTDCEAVERPCPFLACRWNLFLDVNPQTGSVKFNFPGKELDEIGESCALDVADKGGITLEEVGAVMNITRERVRQIETRALVKLWSRVGDEVAR